MSIHPVYVIQLAVPSTQAMRLCIAIVTHWDRRNPHVPVPIGDVYYADGCAAQGYRFAVEPNLAITRIRGYRGRTHVGNIKSHELKLFYNALASTDLTDGPNWTFLALRRLKAHHLDIPIYGKEPVYKGLDEGRRAWEAGDD
ncbi:hypothetical protein GSI_13114 [Ganoderma sinense ZZ0214-1]|uniref:Uncharacterized protein n=1 Tax=Ganoderma sinense ZZ0214-1 TaxID=1077348 RepID=A0A2G8RUN4_9APHY|nr:hypothetical protein GSI_13114 [Ganoderma sinense ZZ0214-1]